MSIIHQLPIPPKNKTGWPWAQESSVWTRTVSSDFLWPKITVVTPSYNQGTFLEETMRSIILQEYPNLEWFVIDGGSTDKSLSLIEKYSPFIDFWVSESDKGQSHALNKGFSRASGDLFCWLNSDDVWLPNTLKEMAYWFRQGYEFVSADTHFIDAQGSFLRKSTNWQRENTLFDLLCLWKEDVSPPQPAMFFSRHLFLEVGPIEESLNFTMDFDLWIKMARHCQLLYVNQVWSLSRVHPEAKGVKASKKFVQEGQFLVKKALEKESWAFRWRYWWVKHTSKGHMARYVPSLIIRFVRWLKRQSL